MVHDSHARQEGGKVKHNDFPYLGDDKQPAKTAKDAWGYLRDEVLT